MSHIACHCFLRFNHTTAPSQIRPARPRERDIAPTSRANFHKKFGFNDDHNSHNSQTCGASIAVSSSRSGPEQRGSLHDAISPIRPSSRATDKSKEKISTNLMITSDKFDGWIREATADNGRCAAKTRSESGPVSAQSRGRLARPGVSCGV